MDVNYNSSIFLDTQTLKSIASIFIRSQEFPPQLCVSAHYQDESVEGIKHPPYYRLQVLVMLR